MPGPYFDRSKLKIHPLARRANRIQIERDGVAPGTIPGPIPGEKASIIREAAGRIRAARLQNKPVALAFGAHLIKNGLGPALIALLESGWITHLATNGAGVIHDWEFAFQGASGEHVRANMASGSFGLWEETGFYINLALAIGAYNGLGYGESVGALIENEGLVVPDPGILRREIASGAVPGGHMAAAADLLELALKFRLKTGRMSLPHPFKRYSVQAAAFRLKVPFTAHPMFGHDIIYTHPASCGAAIGRAAERDFLSFAEMVRSIDGGVYMSVGSAVMSPMVFEKAFAMAQNRALQGGKRIENHFILVVDLARSSWDWAGRGEPPESDPAYYLRYCKTFSRVGGVMRYLELHNRDFLLSLASELRTK